jgi:hypothetical protein
MVDGEPSATAKADPCGMTNKGQTTATAVTKATAGEVRVYIPPIAKNAKDGAPDGFCAG